MRYIKLENNKPINYSLDQLFLDYPDAVIYKDTQMPNKELLANYDVYPLVTTQPELGKYEVLIGEAEAIFKDGEWYQGWEKREMTDEEKTEVDNKEAAVGLIAQIESGVLAAEESEEN